LALSVYFLFDDLRRQLAEEDKSLLVTSIIELRKRLREEAKAGTDRRNRELYALEAMLSSAPGEKYQIERRHQKLIKYFGHFKKTGKVQGD